MKKVKKPMEKPIELTRNMATFNAEINMIKNVKVRNATVAVLSEVNDKFFKAPASSTGKHHPRYALGEGGVVRHTKAAIFFFRRMMDLKSESSKFTRLEKDIVIASLILHDTCKSGVDWEKNFTSFLHPLLVEKLVEEKEVREKLDSEENRYLDMILEAISSHMGEWNTDTHPDNETRGVELPLPESHIQRVVHLCDYLASQKLIDLLQFKVEDEDD